MRRRTNTVGVWGATLGSAAAIASVWIATPDALAQGSKAKEEVFNAPAPNKEDEGAPGVINYLLLVGLVGVVVGVNAIPSKRGHQD